MCYFTHLKISGQNNIESDDSEDDDMLPTEEYWPFRMRGGHW